MSKYVTNFHALDPEVTWPCQGPRHTGAHKPDAISLVLILVNADLLEQRIVVHQASYACSKCVDRMLASVGGE